MAYSIFKCSAIGNYLNPFFIALNMQTPNALSLYCENCGEYTLHRVIKGKIKDRNGRTLEVVARCTVCDSTYTGIIKAPPSRKVPLVISDWENSHRTKIDLPEDEVIRVGDELLTDEDTILVTAIELRGKRVQSARVSNIETIWAKLFNSVLVPVSVNRGARTVADTIEAVPEEEFYIGDTIQVKNKNCVIHQIMDSNGRMLRKGGIMAKNIKRVYARVIRTHTSY